MISGSGDVVTPGSTVSSGNGYQPAVLFTDVTSELYYKNGSLGRLDIPALDLSVRIYQGTDSKTLAKGVGHFEDTSIWEGNVCLAAHNRGANSYFGQIHTLNIGDKITLTTKLGTRTYHVTDVSKVSETDHSGLADSGENRAILRSHALGLLSAGGGRPRLVPRLSGRRGMLFCQPCAQPQGEIIQVTGIIIFILYRHCC